VALRVERPPCGGRLFTEFWCAGEAHPLQAFVTESYKPILDRFRLGRAVSERKSAGTR